MDAGRRATMRRVLNGGAIEELSPREREVLAQLVYGKRNAEIAAALFVGTETVKSHLASIYRKLGVSTRGEAIFVALGGRETPAEEQ